MDQGSTMKRSAVHNFAPTVTKFCVMWEGQALPHDTKFGNSRCEIVGRRVIFIWSLIHGLRWSGLIKAEPDHWFVSDVFVHPCLNPNSRLIEPMITLMNGGLIISHYFTWMRFPILILMWVCWISLSKRVPDLPLCYRELRWLASAILSRSLAHPR